MSEARPAASEPVRWNTAAARAISSSRFHNQRSFGELQSEADGIDPAGVPYHLTAALSSLGIKRRQSVLVVDEDQRHCMVLRDLLSKEFEGLNVDVVHDADAALELLNAGSVSSSCPRDYGLVLIKGPQISGLLENGVIVPLPRAPHTGPADFPGNLRVGGAKRSYGTAFFKWPRATGPD